MDGEQGNLQTLAVMADVVREDRREPDLRNFILREIVGDIRGHDYAGEMDAIFRFTRDRITYRKDPFGVERVADVWSTLYALNPNEPEGDCGIKSVFMATCFAVLGHKPAFVVIKQRPEMKAFNHVYNCVFTENGILYFDATPEDKPAGWETESFEKFIYPIFN